MVRAEDIILPEEYKSELRTLHDQAATFDFPEVGLGTTPAVSSECLTFGGLMRRRCLGNVLVWFEDVPYVFNMVKVCRRHESQEEHFVQRILIAAGKQFRRFELLSSCCHLQVTQIDSN